MADFWLIELNLQSEPSIFWRSLLRGLVVVLLIGGSIFAYRLYAESLIVPDHLDLNLQSMPLLETNLNLDSDWARGGGEVTVLDNALLPEFGPTNNGIENKEANNSGKISVYVVREGDTLSEVAEIFKVSVNTIMWANDLERAVEIQPGQILTILPITGIRHIVTRGDTLASLVKKYEADLGEIVLYNDLDVDATLAIGSTIVIPNGVIEALAPVDTSSPAPRPSSGPSYAGYYIRPIAGGVKTQGLHGYNGVDLANKIGTPIYAAATGKVLISKTGGWNGGYGNYVVIEHDNGTQTLYAHNQSNIVSVGKWVNQGEAIAHIGSTGKSTGPHVHFEVRGAKNPF